MLGTPKYSQSVGKGQSTARMWAKAKDQPECGYETRYSQSVGKGQGTISVWVKDKVKSACG